MRKKYVFFDIDDALTGNVTRKIASSTQKTLDRLQEAGHLAAIATGKAHYKVRGLMEAPGLHNMVYCGGNGLTTNDEPIMNTLLDQQRAVAVYKGTRTLGYGALVMLDDPIDVYDMDDCLLRQCGERREPTNYILHADSGIDQMKGIYKLYISIPEEGEHRFTKKDTPGNLRFVETYLVFQHDRRKEGILDMMERPGGPMEDVVVSGDSCDDLATFDDTWLGITMGNVRDVLKKKMDYATERNVDDGIHKAYLKFGWISQDFDLSSSTKKRRFIYYRFLIDLGNFKQEIQHFYQWKLDLLYPQTPQVRKNSKS